MRSDPGPGPANLRRERAGRRHAARWIGGVGLWIHMVAFVSLAVASSSEWPKLETELLVSGLSRPLGIVAAPDGSGRLFILEQPGRVRILSAGQLLPVPFLDLVAKVSCCGEQGLLGLAFPPIGSEQDQVYVSYTDNRGDSVIARYRISEDPNLADAGSEEILLTLAQPFDNHNGGHIVFGPDGMLYVGFGDGGSGGDPQGNGQDLGTLLGKLLRIDVEGDVRPYAIPPDNPFVGTAGTRPEIWALGVRNPWRYSFDRASGDLWIGDVGQGTWEEVDRLPADSGGGENLGWNEMEGAHCFAASSCDTAGKTLPVAEYSHAEGCSITGGFVARTPSSPRLGGIYVFGDYCSGTIWGLDPNSTPAWNRRELLATSLAISSFGEGDLGALFVADLEGGRVYALREDPTVFAADLGVTASASTSSVALGAPVDLVFRVTNAGPDSATLPRIRVALPPETEIDEGAKFGAQGCALAVSGIQCQAERILAGASLDLTFTARRYSYQEGAFLAVVEAGETDAASANNAAAITVAVVEVPLAVSAEASPARGEAPLETRLAASVVGGRPPFTYLWDFGDGSATSTEASPVHAFVTPGAYQPQVTVTDANGSSVRATLLVEATRTWAIPAVTHAPGVAGTTWRTDLAIVNRSAGPSSITLSFLSGAAAITRSATLPAQGTEQWEDVLVALFGVDPSAATSGAVTIVAAADVVASSRVYNLAATGTFGQSLPALGPSMQLVPGAAATLPQLASNANFRTNVGAFNQSDETVEIEIRLFGADGAVLGQPVTLSVPGHRWSQKNDVFAAAAAGEARIAYASVRLLSRAGSVWVYASVIDNRTGDPTTIPMLDVDDLVGVRPPR